MRLIMIFSVFTSYSWVVFVDSENASQFLDALDYVCTDLCSGRNLKVVFYDNHSMVFKKHNYFNESSKDKVI